ncbi:antibiotic biosynthesis monooxygenase [Nocardia arizonensis]|uniref:antibiotic biosynthesis monooxygenase n=1 Tax=Nocardia arizonensis TaxID=1141647 RepID=UPI000AAFC178|nr:antibiotic biosynthesis monooxygenase [Nocardia arizonensis]
MTAAAVNATAVSVFHRRADAAGFHAWLVQLTEIAAAAPGFVRSVRAVDDVAPLAPGLSVTFRTPAQAHDFLDSAARSRVIAEGQRRGFQRSGTDLVLVPGELPPPGIGVFRHSVIPGKETEFVATEARLVALSAAFPGFESAALFGDAGSGGWMSVLRFRTPAHLAAWMASPQRAAALPDLRSELTEDFVVAAHTTPFGSTLRTVDGRTRVTPTWKVAMLVLLVLYPTVMTLSRFLGPVLDGMGVPPWLGMWLSQIVSVGLMSWLLSPAVAACFRRWLDPVDGAGRRVSLAGAAAVVVLYALTLLLFASVTWLQYWDYD